MKCRVRTSNVRTMLGLRQFNFDVDLWSKLRVFCEWPNFDHKSTSKSGQIQVEKTSLKLSNWISTSVSCRNLVTHKTILISTINRRRNLVEIIDRKSLYRSGLAGCPRNMLQNWEFLRIKYTRGGSFHESVINSQRAKGLQLSLIHISEPTRPY